MGLFSFFFSFFYFTGRFRERYPGEYEAAVFSLFLRALRYEGTRMTSPVHLGKLFRTIAFLECSFFLSA